ncbi:hypothetical protein AGOR_G00032120 [Albula goreensis]|uniref:C2H2-type domain-containing protein n=1 Tax=Albula goreensis TaxID=1534307 RepID=A0A8T3DZ63_9TELE|nr:hypothetical protein AGOR_G00032120 [Albula goreensis]
MRSMLTISLTSKVLFNVAVVEITKLFEGGFGVSEGESPDPKTPRLVRDELRSRAESALGHLGKKIRSVGVQVRDEETDGERWHCRSEGKAALPAAAAAADAGTLLWESGEHTDSAAMEVDGLQSVALEFELMDVQWEQSPPAAPPVGWMENNSGVLHMRPASEPEGVGGGGAKPGGQPPFEQRLCEAELDQRPTPAKKEQVAESIPAGAEQVADPAPVEEEKKQETEPTPAGKKQARDPGPAEQQLAHGPAPPALAPPPFLAGGWEEGRRLRPCSVQLVNVLLISSRGQARDGRGRKGVSLPKDLRPHQRLHTGKRPCCFTQCGNGVWRLQAHTHACQLCGKKFKRKKVLKRHQRFHTGEKPYPCTYCRKTFALRKNLRRHERFHTGERPYGCSRCGKTFRLRESLKTHLRFHTGERPYPCTVCARRFRILRNLERHQLTHEDPAHSLQ